MPKGVYAMEKGEKKEEEVKLWLVLLALFNQKDSIQKSSHLVQFLQREEKPL